ncbi:MAG: S8 family serine peptidase [Thermoanaerobaculia bacterium]
MRRFFVCATGGIFLSLSVLAGEWKIDPSIFASTPEGERASFLVVLREQADLSGAESIRDSGQRRRFVFEALREVAGRTQAPLLERLRESGAHGRSHYLVNMLEVEADRFVAADLAAREEVSHLAPNRPASLRRLPELQDSEASSASSSVSRLPSSAVGPNLVRIRAPEVWAQGFTGQGIIVGNADTGFAWEHPAVKPHYRGFDGAQAVHDYNWHDAIHDASPGNPCGSNSPAPCDDEGHGTGTAGLSVGDDGAGHQIGVAPGARLIGCRNMDRSVGTPARYTECFEFFLAPTDSGGGSPRPELGADVINNSWACPPSEGCTDPNILRAVVENVRAAGIFVVVAAGNEGSGCATVSNAPAIYDASFSIGATTSGDTIASFSSRGPVAVDGSNRLKPDLVAPGVAVQTATPPDGFTPRFQGTSAAAPHVAGAVALLWSAAPALRGDVAATEEVLIRSAAPLAAAQDCPPFPGAQVPNAVFGFGRLDVAGAVALASPATRLFPRPLDRRGATRALPPRP